ARHPLADLAQFVSLPDLEIALEQIDDWQVARRLAIRDRRSLEDQPVLYPMRVGELVGQPRFADSRLAHYGHDLAVAGASPPEHRSQLPDPGAPAHEARQPTERRRLEPCPRLPRPSQLEDLDGLRQALYRHRP